MAPVEGEKKAAGQATQERAPLAGCMVPAAQGLQTPASQNVPGGHSAQDWVAATV